MSLPWLLEQQAALAASSPVIKGRSVILLFLSGGPSQFETFDPKPDEPAEIRHTQFAHNAGGREYKINDGKGRIVREILG